MIGQYSSIEPKVKHGEFMWYYPNGNKKLHHIYRNDSLMIFQEFDESGRCTVSVLKKEYVENLSQAEKEKRGIKKRIEEPAEFPGGEEKLLEYINSHTNYPQEAQDKKIEGRVIVRFTVSKSGRIKNVTSLYYANPILIKEARRLVLSMPKWKPAKDKGKIVEDIHAIPIVFKLE